MAGQQTLRTISVIATSLVGCAAVAEPEQDFSGAYFCTAEAAGGVRFNDSTERWQGTRFTADTKRIITIERGGKVLDVVPESLDYYYVTYKYHGEDIDLGCVDVSDTLSEFPQLIHINDGEISCKTYGGWLEVNLRNGRFLQTSTAGYTDGIDNNRNTPAVVIGTCSRIR